MALSRAFTKKDATKEDKPSRSFFSSKPPPSIRNKISSPLALLSTTNQLAYNAPDLFPNGASSNSATSTPVSSTSNGFAPLTLSTNIGSGTPFSETDEVPELLHSNSSTPDSSTRGSTPTSTEPNHLSGYFAAAVEEKRKSDEAPVRSMSRAGKVGELLNRKRSESRVGRSPAGSVSHKAAQKPSLQSFDEGKIGPQQFSPAPFNATPKSPLKDKFEPAGFAPVGFAPVGFNNGPKNGGGLNAPSGGGLMRKNTVRARGSIDMFSPGMGVENKPSISNLRDRRQGEDNKPKPFEEKLNVVKPSNSIKDRQVSNPSPLQNQNTRSPLLPKASASHADLRSAADGKHPALRAKASLNIRPSTANAKVIPPARSFTHTEQSGRHAPSPMGLGMRKASPIDEAMATLDEVAKDMGVERQVKREERKQTRSPQQESRTKTITLKTRIVDGEKTFMAENAHTFTALDYVSEIQDLSEFLFPELKVRREALERNKSRGMAGVVQAAQMQQYNMI